MSFSFKISSLFGIIIAIGAGIWLNQMPVLDQTKLFVVFQLVSLTGVIAAVLWWLDRDDTSLLTGVFVVIAAVIAWRVSYFPIMIFAGWIATLGEQLQFTLDKDAKSSVIYPIFLLAMYFMHSIAVWAAGTVATMKQKLLFVIIFPAFTIAVMVSFSTQSDLTIFPDDQMELNQPLPSVKLPVSNPYLPALEDDEAFTLAQRVFIFSAGSIYALIPHSPWSKVVKGTIEEEFRNQPHSSTNNRILEHYLAYHVAHSRIKCMIDCS